MRWSLIGSCPLNYGVLPPHLTIMNYYQTFCHFEDCEWDIEFHTQEDSDTRVVISRIYLDRNGNFQYIAYPQGFPIAERDL